MKLNIFGITLLIAGFLSYSNVLATEASDLAVLLADQPDKQTLIDSLQAAKTQQELIRNWQAVVNTLNKSYYVARDDLSGFKRIQKVIVPLQTVLTDCVTQLQGKLGNNPELAGEILQLHFRVANYYSIANDFKQAGEWLDKADKFMYANSLQNTKDAAVYHNLRGGELSRQFQAGVLKSYPADSIKEFELALAIHKKLGNTLKDNTHMRHIQMCLAGVIVQDATWTTMHEGKVTKSVKTKMARATTLLDELEPFLGEDGYRIAGALQIRSGISTLQGDFDKSLALIDRAKAAMPQKDTGQLSQLLNEYANVCVAMAEAHLLQSTALTAGKAENMYSVQANKSMQEISTHPYAKLARIVLQK